MPTPVPQPVAYDAVMSSNIAALGYGDGVGYVEFNGGRRFGYAMPLDVFTAMKTAKSIGAFFAKNVKGVFRVTGTWQRCDSSPCSHNATVHGVVAGIAFRLCDTCAADPRHTGLTLTPIPAPARA